MHCCASRRIAELDAARAAHQAELDAVMKMVEVTSGLRAQADRRVAQLEAQHAQDAEALAGAWRQAEGAVEAQSEGAKRLKVMAAQMTRDEKELADLRGQLKTATSSAAGAGSGGSGPSTPDGSGSGGVALRLRVAELESHQQAGLQRARRDAESIAVLQAELDAHRRARQAAEAVDVKRVKDIRDVNEILAAFAQDDAFHEDIRRPLVGVALAAWRGQEQGGGLVVGGGLGVGAGLSQADLDAASADEGFVRISPLLRRFESLCDLARIRLPLDHVVARQTELSAGAAAAHFGPDFVARYYVDKRWTLDPAQMQGQGQGQSPNTDTGSASSSPWR